MAYLPNQGTTEEEDKQGVNAPFVSSETGTVESGGGGGPGQPQPTRSGSFTNLQTYIRQNQAQAPLLGERVGQNIAQKGLQAREALSGASQAFNTAAQSKTPTIDETLLQKSMATPQGLSPEEIQRFQAQRFATYGGPQQLQDIGEYGSALSKIQGAEQYGNLLGSEAGRQQLVGDLYGTRTRGPGMLALDAYLLQRTPQALAAAQQGQQALASLSGEKTAAEAAAKAQAEAGQQGAQGVQQRYQEAFFGPEGAIETTGRELEQRAQTQREDAIKAQQRAQDALARLSAAYASGSTTSFDPGTQLPAWAQSIGLDQKGYDDLVNALQQYSVFDYGGVDPWSIYKVWDGHGTTNQLAPSPPSGTVDTISTIRPEATALSDIYRAKPIDIGQYAQLLPQDVLSSGFTPESVATAEERARLAALEQLLGTDIGYYSGAASPASSQVGMFDLASALERIREADKLANQIAYQQYVTSGGR